MVVHRVIDGLFLVGSKTPHRSNPTKEDLLPGEVWARICRVTATTRGGRLKVDFARGVLFERLSGLPVERSPLGPIDAWYRGKLAGFLRGLTPELAEHLDRVAREFLDSNDLAHEPILWHPPVLSWIRCLTRQQRLTTRYAGES